MPYRKTGSPHWWISYTDATGRRIRCSAGTTEHATAKAIEQQHRAEGFKARRKTAGIGVAADTIMTEYLSQPGRLHKRSRSTARALAGHFAGLSIHDIDRAEIARYIDHRRADSRSDSTIKRELTLWSAAVTEYGKRHNIELPNHARSFALKEPESRVRWITHDEASRLIAAASPIVADFIAVGLYTGMRTGEMLGLEWTRVDFSRRQILLESHHTKSARRRSIPIHDTALAALLRCRMRCAESAYVFCSSTSATGRMDNIKKGFASACKKAGITDFRPHDLRHTCASWLVMAGISLYEVRDILGHASIKMTERYAHLAPENLQAAVGTLRGI